MQTYNLMKSGLNAAQLRSKTIANNIANINTPNYKRKYVKFEETLNNVNKTGKIEVKTEMDEEKVVNLIQSYAVVTEHDDFIANRINKYLKENNLNTLAHMFIIMGR